MQDPIDELAEKIVRLVTPTRDLLKHFPVDISVKSNQVARMIRDAGSGSVAFHA